ncbi:MAG TPA: LptF/LptG family permease [Gemmatimonadales bacterium]|nr:LptF/LptG family permease [Gemmatimonadales bacterium]
MFRILDRYLLGSWIRIFLLTALGFPLVDILLKATERVGRLLERGISPGTIALSYLYMLPESMSQMIPAATLFATVFTLGPFSRNSELTAAKAGGVSFHRLIVPLVVAAIVASVASFYVGELSTHASQKALELQKERRATSITVRYNFVYRGDLGWVYTIRSLDVANRQLKQVMFEREGAGLENPGLVITADSASWDDSARAWRVRNGASRVIAGPGEQAMFSFHTMRLKALTQSPADLLAEAKAPDEMRYAELGRYIEGLRRSGNDANKLIVEQALKVAIPVTCFIIAIFGAPLAVTNPRAGAAVGIAISLGTTVLFLLITQIMKAVGAGGVVDPLMAAWIPNIVFALAGVWLLVRVRT